MCIKILTDIIATGINLWIACLIIFISIYKLQCVSAVYDAQDIRQRNSFIALSL